MLVHGNRCKKVKEVQLPSLEPPNWPERSSDSSSEDLPSRPAIERPRRREIVEHEGLPDPPHEDERVVFEAVPSEISSTGSAEETFDDKDTTMIAPEDDTLVAAHDESSSEADDEESNGDDDENLDEPDNDDHDDDEPEDDDSDDVETEDDSEVEGDDDDSDTEPEPAPAPAPVTCKWPLRTRLGKP